VAVPGLRDQEVVAVKVPQQCPNCLADLSDPAVPPGVDKTLFGLVILNKSTWECPACGFEWMVKERR
jgi:hypothetical protein